MTRSRRIAMGVVAAITTILLLGGLALAADVRVICFIDVKPSAKLEQGYAIGIRVVSTDDKPVNEATVRVYEIVDFYGKHEMPLGSTVTDGQGRASLNYLPARTGSHELVARFAGKTGYVATEGHATFQAELAAEPYVVEPPPLAAFTSKVPYAVGALVLAVWGLIGYALIGTVRGVIGGARNSQRKGHST
jgi:hypothetical protein